LIDQATVIDCNTIEVQQRIRLSPGSGSLGKFNIPKNFTAPFRIKLRILILLKWLYNFCLPEFPLHELAAGTHRRDSTGLAFTLRARILCDVK
jgi:hypothetical protein